MSESASARSSTPQTLWRQAERVLASDGPCPSPCVSVCRMSAQTQLCEGCWRDIEELRAWGKSDDDYKREVWGRIQERLRHALAPEMR